MQRRLRNADERGATRLSWLDSKHSFSFADYDSPEWPGFLGLRVLNEDVIAPGAGFGEHPHRNAEILSFVLEGALLHQDSTGERSVISAGEVQRMTAGRGVTHSEWNASQTDPVRFVQVWLDPLRPGEAPSFDHATDDWRRAGAPVLVASRDGHDGSLPLHADAEITAARLAAGSDFRHEVGEQRGAWLQVLSGTLGLAGTKLDAGDGLALRGAGELEISTTDGAELLLFDLADRGA